MTSRASASAVAAPPMSFFISSMPLDGLMSRPPRVEDDALADQRHLRRVLAPPAEVDETRRLGRGLADGVDEREIAFEQIVAARRLERRAEFLGEPRGLALERRRAEIVGGRVDEVAAERDGAGDRLEPRGVDAVGRRPAAAARPGRRDSGSKR